MLRRVILPVIFLILIYGFWISPDFKEIAAGVSIFLFGMLFLEEGFRAFTGGVLEKVLKKTTDKRWKSVAFGVVSTTIMQSSSLVSVLTISFLSAGLIWLSSGIGIILGANIGTTTGAWLVAGLGLKVKISAYAMPMLVFGIILVFQKSKSLKGVGYVLAGLGFLFLGIHHMKEGFEAFKSTIDLAAYAMPGFLGLAVFILIGVFATVVMQSSHATLVLIITALAAGQITYENALALAIGANIGTTITAILGAMSANYQGKRLAAAHLVFNMSTGAIAIAFISQMVWAVDAISMRVGIAEDDYALKLAVFHTIFNVVGVVVMYPFVDKLVKALQKLFPKPAEKAVEPHFINEAAFDFPETLLESVRYETLHLYDNAVEIIAHGLNMHRTTIYSQTKLKAAIKSQRTVIEINLEQVYATKVKVLYGAILDFISQAQMKLPPDFSEDLYTLRGACYGVVRSTKEVQQFRENVSLYMRSDNPHIRKQYDAMRLQIARLLRAINEMRNMPEEDRDVLSLDDFRLEFEKKNIVHNGTMDELIRGGLITAHMATSLMNDLGFLRNIIWNLTDMGKAVFATKDIEAQEADELMALDEDDIEEISHIEDEPSAKTVQEGSAGT
jgi:phosphate:Na+ symporter